MGSKSRWKLEARILLKNIKLFCCVSAMQFIHSAMTNIAYYRHIQGERLKDLGFEIIPQSPEYFTIFSEILFFSALTIIILFSLVPFLHKNPLVYSAVLWLRCMFVMSLCLICRCLSFLSTSLPGPASHCQPMSKEYSPPETIYDILFHVDGIKGCGDLIFSSHTSLSLCLILTVFVYGKQLVPHKLYRIVVYFILLPAEILMLILIIAARKHYTVDVVVAMYTTPLIYYASYYFVKDEDLSNLDDDEQLSKFKNSFEYETFPLFINEFAIDDEDKLNVL